MPNIEVNYTRIGQMVEEANSVIRGGLSSAVGDYSKVGSGISKSAGETLDAIKAQAAAEQQLAGAMADVCAQFVSSISYAAESFRGLDAGMTSAMNFR